MGNSGRSAAYDVWYLCRGGVTAVVVTSDEDAASSPSSLPALINGAADELPLLLLLLFNALSSPSLPSSSSAADGAAILAIGTVRRLAEYTAGFVGSVAAGTAVVSSPSSAGTANSVVLVLNLYLPGLYLFRYAVRSTAVVVSAAWLGAGSSVVLLVDDSLYRLGRTRGLYGFQPVAVSAAPAVVVPAVVVVVRRVGLSVPLNTAATDVDVVLL